MANKKTTQEEIVETVINNEEAQQAELAQPEKEEVKKTPINPDRLLTKQELIKKYTINDTNGLPLFVDTEKVKAALTMTDEEASKFLGGADPKKYFRQGKIEDRFVKILGDLLPEDRYEVQVLRKVLPNFPDILMFKQPIENLYNLVIPKRLSEEHLDEHGDFLAKNIDLYHIPVNFHAGVSTAEFGRFPASFEATFFERFIQRSKSKLEKAAQVNLLR